MPPQTAVALPESSLRANCAREVFAVAEALWRAGRQRFLRDVTIVLPIDYTAVAAVELACLVLSEGELSEAAANLELFLDQVTADSASAERFIMSVRSVVRRVVPKASVR